MLLTEMHLQPLGDFMKKLGNGHCTKPFGLTYVVVNIRMSVFVEPDVTIVVLVHDQYLRNNQLFGVQMCIRKQVANQLFP